MHSSLVFCGGLALACTVGVAATVPTGGYDGTYDPSSTTPPQGMTSWVVVQGHNCTITPNTPAPGQALFADKGLQIGSYLNIKKHLDAKPWILA